MSAMWVLATDFFPVPRMPDPGFVEWALTSMWFVFLVCAMAIVWRLVSALMFGGPWWSFLSAVVGPLLEGVLGCVAVVTLLTFSPLSSGLTVVCALVALGVALALNRGLGGPGPMTVAPEGMPTGAVHTRLRRDDAGDRD